MTKRKLNDMNKFFYLLLVIFFVLTVTTSCGDFAISNFLDNISDSVGNTTADNYVLYENQEEGISLEYPSKWSFGEKTKYTDDLILYLEVPSEARFDVGLFILKDKNKLTFSKDYNENSFFGNFLDSITGNFNEDDISTLHQIFGEDINIIDFLRCVTKVTGDEESDITAIELDKIPAIKVTGKYDFFGDYNLYYYIAYLYAVDTDIYGVLYMASEDKFNSCESTFEKIILSYKCNLNNRPIPNNEERYISLYYEYIDNLSKK